MVAGDSGSKHNGGRSAAVCAVNSMVSEASAATVAVLDVIGGVSAGMVTNVTVAFGAERLEPGVEYIDGDGTFVKGRSRGNPMADFSDEEDLLLYRLAKEQVDAGRRINWRTVWLGMPYCGKTQRQLQIRLKTLKRTHGVSAPDNIGNVHDAVSSLYASALRQPVHAPDCHAGEISPTGVSAILAVIPTLTIADAFVDFGSGIGNVVAQVALETCVGRCIGIEFQDNLANMSKLLIRGARVDFPNLSKVTIHEADLRAMSPADFASSAAGLVHVVVMATICGGHRPTCPRNFCSVWTLRSVSTFTCLGLPSFITHTGTPGL
ncbi:hypothetical protein PHYSODRAFT_338705 [Phytophthora sojae]|uniref:Histone-lysine N-methyltransferase, H3 lysine-79 specific n=1 Tax=Phytophthora sojae (strain P6497) TaxID=1094619 RepID=G5A2W5_PHYSP|nr:hypothetical protein PHYSODRAFT_338705 [Phytophthora sojae]EGZ10005.1 hypothetical protein PHYSODRAFT_338705 [Phytophthora sojae]|eukprot:XP_009534866.1 hypothetical protein PHYSODRAFT_338705 [Phytophthora sojae]